MFAFHKPRVYRSTDGCCICRAKSSSSRFTDSRKYESDSMKCFALQEPRQGEICNACVLLVKRFKRLPPGSTRHWGHVVDARAGPGTKSMSKYKKQRGETNTESRNTITTVATVSTTQSSKSRSTSSTSHKSYIGEKFNKIFRKAKKSKGSSVVAAPPPPQQQQMQIVRANPIPTSSRCRSSTAAWPVSDKGQRKPLLAIMPPASAYDVRDSDYDEAAGSQSTCTTVVLFQTQTRAAAHRSRHHSVAASTNVGIVASTSPRQVGSKRRKSVAPRKHRRRHYAEQQPFYDAAEWQQRNICCGSWLECQAMAGVLLIDVGAFKPCDAHKQLHQQQQQQALQQKLLPPVVVPVHAAPASTSLALTTTTTTALKKHHLFFKRQSELFPQGDGSDYIATTTANTTTTTTRANDMPQQQQQQQLVPIATRHSSTIATISSSANAKSHNFLHKIIKAGDTALSPAAGKIVKHSAAADRLVLSNAAPAALRAGDMRHIAKPVDKTYVLATAANSNNHKQKPHQQQQLHQAPLQLQQQPTAYSNTTTTVAAASPSPTLSSSSSSSSTSSTKFSDNSSDSGFDENLLERKSASPLQEDTERKLLTRPAGAVQTLFLASGVQIQGQQQNLQLTGNEMAAKLLQQRKVTTTVAVPGHSQRSAAMKIAQIIGANSSGAAGTVGLVTHSKMRAIYHNNKTIQHENGVTTIVPASSLAASTQMAAMHQAVGPSTVTITPALNTRASAATHLNAIQIGNSNSCSSSNMNNANQKIILVKAGNATARYGGNNTNHSNGNNHNNSNAFCAPAAMQMGAITRTTVSNNTATTTHKQPLNAKN